MTTDVTLDQVLALARRLRPIDQARLVARLVPAMEQMFIEPQEHITHPPLRGLLGNVGHAPSEIDITEVQKEMWATFAEEGI
jgi:hypothetical protein